jgi:hypothetical protein
MVVDYIYSEYGYDKEAIRAAMKKWNVLEDEYFADYIQTVREVMDNSFLNL